MIFKVFKLVFRKLFGRFYRPFVWIKDDDHAVKRAYVNQTPFGPILANSYRGGSRLLEKNGKVKLG